MTFMEKEPEITVCMFDSNGGSHVGSVQLFEEIASEQNSNKVQVELPDAEDITDMLAMQAVRASRLRVDWRPVRHTKFTK